MSRIHEALKRAEQDRAEAQAVQIESTPSVKASNTPAAFHSQGNTPPVISSTPSISIDHDKSLLRCTPSNWCPDKKTMLFFNDEQGPGTEEFRTLRSRLYQMREKQPLKKILVTSSLPKEGKSFVAANLAQALAWQQGRRVLLVDGDLRASRLHLALGSDSTPGLSEYLQGEVDEHGVMQRGVMENLFFIPAGRSSANPGELIANGCLKVLLSRLEELFDWIILDSPPAVPVSDAGLMANACDGVLMVVRSNATPADMALKARAEFADRLLLGVVLNGVKNTAGSYGKYYEAYGRPGESGRVRGTG